MKLDYVRAKHAGVLYGTLTVSLIPSINLITNLHHCSHSFSPITSHSSTDQLHHWLTTAELEPQLRTDDSTNTMTDQQKFLCPRLIDYLAIVGSRGTAAPPRSNLGCPGGGNSPTVQVSLKVFSYSLTHNSCPPTSSADPRAVTSLPADGSQGLSPALGHGVLLPARGLSQRRATQDRASHPGCLEFRVHVDG